MKQQFKKRTFTIGGDPEFVLKDMKNAHLVQAADYPFFNKVGANHKIGRDGNSNPVEIRPQPTYINLGSGTTFGNGYTDRNVNLGTVPVYSQPVQ